MTGSTVDNKRWQKRPKELVPGELFYDTQNNSIALIIAVEPVTNDRNGSMFVTFMTGRGNRDEQIVFVNMLSHFSLEYYDMRFIRSL